jgi:hypothetical protein
LPPGSFQYSPYYHPALYPATPTTPAPTLLLSRPNYAQIGTPVQHSSPYPTQFYPPNYFPHPVYYLPVPTSAPSAQNPTYNTTTHPPR